MGGGRSVGGCTVVEKNVVKDKIDLKK